MKEEFQNNGINSKEFVYVYYIIDDVDTSMIKYQKEEVSAAACFNKEEFQELVNTNKIIKHDKEFKLIEKILN